MTESTRHEVDLVIKPLDRWIRILNTAASLLAAVAVAIGIWFGYRELSALTLQLDLQSEQTELQRLTLENEWRQKFFDNQIEIYGEVADVVGKIAVLRDDVEDIDHVDGTEFAKQTREFQILFWGKMCIVEGSDVEQAMIQFELGLREKLGAGDLKQLAFSLVHVCRNETNERYFLTYAERKRRESKQFGSNTEILKKMADLTSAASPEGKTDRHTSE